MKIVNISGVEPGPPQSFSSDMLLKPAGKFFLLIEGERVGPFVQTGGNDRLLQILRDRGILIENDMPRSNESVKGCHLRHD